MTPPLFFLVLAIILLVAVVALLRSRKLREKYAALWIVVTVLVVVLALFPDLLEYLATAVGVVVPSNLLFALSLLLLLGVTLHLSLEVSRLDDETRMLSEEVAIHRLQLREHAELLAAARETTAAEPAAAPHDDLAFPRVAPAEDDGDDDPAPEEGTAHEAPDEHDPSAAPESAPVRRSAR